jgi:capsular exopolysaccharide synthesis family protein
MREMNSDSSGAGYPPPQIPLGSEGSTDEELSLNSIGRTIFKRKWIILCTTAVVFTAVAIHTMSTTPVFESVARLQIDPSRSSNLGLDDLINEKLGSSDSSNRLQTEVRLIQSNTVAARVITSLGLAKNPAFAGPSAAKATVTDTAAMTARERQRLVHMFLGSLKVVVLTNTQLLEVHFQSTDPKLATDVANAVAEQYMQRNFQTRYEGAVQVSNWLAQQMEELQTKAVEAQKKLAEFQKQNNILGADENDNIVTDRLKLLNSQVTEAEADRIVKEARHRMAQAGDPELVGGASPSLGILRSQEAELKAQIAQMGAKYGSGYPKLAELQVRLTKLEASIASEVRNTGKRLEDDYLSAVKTETLLRNQFNEQKNAAYQLNEHAVQYSVLKHEVETSSELYDTLQQRLKVAGVTAGLNSSYISVVDPAEVPATPVEPKVRMNLVLGFFGGIITGLLLAFFVESIDDTVSSSSELESFIALPVLCSIPFSASIAPVKTESGSSAKSVPSGPILLNNPRSAAAEAFRGLRTSLLLSSPDRQPKAIAIVSSLAGEGKTTVSVNLAISFAQRGETVLLIDADLRRSTIHSQFGLPPSRYGLSTILTQGANERALIKPLESLPSLTLLPAGPHPPNPAELLGSKRMVEVLKSFATQYDRVILDTPPVLSVADSLSLANLADAVVLVVRSGTARKKAVLRVRDLLQRTNSNLVGIVFNCVDLRLEQYYYAHGANYGKTMRDYYTSEEE